jgi:hypothetical protein
VLVAKNNGHANNNGVQGDQTTTGLAHGNRLAVARASCLPSLFYRAQRGIRFFEKVSGASRHPPDGRLEALWMGASSCLPPNGCRDYARR